MKRLSFRPFRLLTLGIAAGAFAALSGAAVSAQERYILREGDRIAVSVMEDPVMNQNSLIRPDGRISVPIVGSVEAAGRTPEALQNLIASRLSSTFAFRPTVTVALLATSDPEIEEIEIPFIYILGQVNSPGRFEMIKPISLLQALAMAGGPGAFAAADRIFVRRGGGDGETVATFDYTAFEDGEGANGNVLLQEGDIIVVPERGLFD